MPKINTTSTPLPPELQACEYIMAASVKALDGEGSAMTMVVSPGLNGNASSIVYTGANSFDIGASPNNQDTLFGFGSNTKGFISAMIQVLIARGEVNLSDPISKHLPEFFADGKYPDWGQVTIQQLLNMTSGIPDFLNGSSSIWSILTQNINKSWTPLGILNVIPYKGQVTSPPGGKYSYSNTNYLLLGQLIENKIRKPIRDVFADWIQTAGLTGKVYFKPEVIINDPKLAPFWAHLYENGDNSANVNQADYSSAGAVIGTAEGLMNWIVEGLYGGKMVTPAQLASMRQWVSENTAQPVSGATEQDPNVYGLGLAQMWLSGWGQVDYYQGDIDGATAGWYRVPTSQGIVTFVITVNTWWTNLPKPLPVLVTEFLAKLGAQPDPKFGGDSAKAKQGYPSVPALIPGWGTCKSYSWKVHGEKATWFEVPTSNMGMKTIVVSDKDVTAASPKSIEQLVVERLIALGAKPELLDAQIAKAPTITAPKQLSSFFKPGVDQASSKKQDDCGCLSSLTDAVSEVVEYASAAVNAFNDCADQIFCCDGAEESEPETEKERLRSSP